MSAIDSAAVLLGGVCGLLLLEYVRLWRRTAPLRDEAESARHEAEMARIGRDDLWRAALAYLAAHAAADAADEAIDDAADRVAATTAAGHAACAEADALDTLRRATQGDRP